MKLLEALHAINEERFTYWVTTWTIPGESIREFPMQHHAETAASLLSEKNRVSFSGQRGDNFIDPDDAEAEALEMGWVRGGFYEGSFLDKIYMDFDENHAGKKDVYRTLEFLKKMFKQKTGNIPDSVITPSGEILLKDFAFITSDLR